MAGLTKTHSSSWSRMWLATCQLHAQPGVQACMRVLSREDDAEVMQLHSPQCPAAMHAVLHFTD